MDVIKQVDYIIDVGPEGGKMEESNRLWST